MKRNETERRLEAAAKLDPKGAGAVFADWLEDGGRAYEAACWRQRAGLSQLFFQIVPKGEPVSPPHTHRCYNSLSAARGAITNQFKWRHKDQVPEWEVRVWESRLQLAASLPAKRGEEG